MTGTQVQVTHQSNQAYVSLTLLSANREVTRV